MKLRIVGMLGDVAKALVQPLATRKYPAVRTPTPERLRGKLAWNPAQCTGCGLCTKDCPANAIALITVDKAAKRFVIRYAVDRCTFCGQCVESCRFNCLTLDHNQWELAETTRNHFTIYLGDKANVDTVVERGAASAAASPPSEP